MTRKCHKCPYDPCVMLRSYPLGYESIPIQTRSVRVATQLLQFGFKGYHCRFDYRPYFARNEEERADMDLLAEHIKENGIQKPLIVYPDGDSFRTLIGTRRGEIAMMLEIPSVDVVIIEENVHAWWKHDIKRLRRLQNKIGEVNYGKV